MQLIFLDRTHVILLFKHFLLDFVQYQHTIWYKRPLPGIHPISVSVGLSIQKVTLLPNHSEPKNCESDKS